MFSFLNEPKPAHVDFTRLIEITKNSDLFKKVFDEQGNDKIHIACCKQMTIKNYHQGEVIIRFGEAAKDFFVILEGRVSIRIPHSRSRPTIDPPKLQDDEKIAAPKWNLSNKTFGISFLNKILGFESHEEVKILNSGESFGELALISDRPRAATVIAKSKVVLGILSKDVFQKQLARFAEKSLIDKINFLQSLPMFKMRSKLQLMKISYYFSLKKLNWNQILYKEGEEMKELYIVKSGDFLLTQKMNKESNKGINKHHRQSSHPIDLKLVKLGPGMILGVSEALAGEKIMRQSAHCASNVAEAFSISKHVNLKQDFDSKVFKPEFAGLIRENYNDTQGFVKERYLASCRTERVKSSMDSYTSNTKISKDSKVNQLLNRNINNERRSVLSNLKSGSSTNLEPSKLTEILYTNRRVEKSPIDSKLYFTSRTAAPLRSTSTLGLNQMNSIIFKTQIPEETNNLNL